MKQANEEYIIVGKIGAPYGVHGWLKIHSYMEFGASILEYNPWFLGQENLWQTIKIEESKIQNNAVLAKLSGINSPEEARLFTGKMIAIPRAYLPKLKKNEFYWSDLQGLTVINKQGEVLGKVSYLIETGSNDVLVVKGSKEFAIPYLLGSVVLSVDLDKQEIIVDWDLI